MSKDPAFLFYPGDWLGGTMTFTRSHKGAYMDLLMAQHSTGHMSIEDIKIILGNDFDSMWESKLKSKFIQDSDGKFFNQKLENEIDKRRAYTKSRGKNLSGDKPHMDDDMESHMDSHMENGNDNGNKDANKIEYRHNVKMTLKEYETFLGRYGVEPVNWMIEKLSAYKDAKGKKYKSDAGAIRSWVIDEWEKKHKKPGFQA